MKSLNHSTSTPLSFRRQWYLGKDPPVAGSKWIDLELFGGFKLYHHPDLVTKSIRKQHDGVIQLGVAVNPNNITEKIIETLFSIQKNTRKFETYLEELGGSYVIISFINNILSIYNDPSGMMGVYFSNDSASSTPTLLGNKLNHNLYYDSSEGNDWYTGSLTPYLGVKKLIPNHCLDLFSSTIKRYWPQNDLKPRFKKEVPDLLESTSKLLQGMISGATLSFSPLCSITGGQDSRVVLAASLPVKDRISYFTLRGNGVKSCDIRYPIILARQCNIKHRFVDITETPEWLYKYYDEIGGGEAIGARRTISGTCLGLAPDSKSIHINGNLGALCKSFYWHNRKPASFKITAILKHFKDPNSIIRIGIQEWHKTTPDLPPDQLYNLFYLEQRGGRWMSAGENCSRLFYESFAPFNHRKIFNNISSFPLSIQYGGKILKKLVRHMAPNLAQIPYCRSYRNWSKYIPEKIKQRLRR